MEWAMDDIIHLQDGKLNLLKDYLYVGVQQKCLFHTQSAIQVIHSYIWVDSGDQLDLAAKIADHGPVSVAIDASNWSFQLYSNGIYDEPSCSTTSLNHVVSYVGYGNISGEVDYCIV
jgi:hypothetical protein